MHPVETHLFDEIRVPNSLEIHNSNHGIYLSLMKDYGENLFIKEINGFSDKKVFAVAGKGDLLGPFRNISDQVYFTNGWSDITRISGNETKTKSIEDIFEDEGCDIKFTKNRNKEIYDFSSDGKFLYVTLSIGRTLVLDKDIKYLKSLHIRDVFASDTLQGNSCFFAPRGEFSWDQYSNGEFIRNFSLKEGILSERMSILDRPFGSKVMDRYEPCSFGFTDGFNLYAVSSKGNVWHVGLNGSKNILETEYKESENEITYANNGFEVAIVVNENMHLFSKGISIGSGKIEGKNKVKSICMDDKFIYLLNGSRLQRYCVLR